MTNIILSNEWEEAILKNMMYTMVDYGSIKIMQGDSTTDFSDLSQANSRDEDVLIFLEPSKMVSTVGDRRAVISASHSQALKTGTASWFWWRGEKGTDVYQAAGKISKPVKDSYWVNTGESKWGIHEYVVDTWVEKTPTVEHISGDVVTLDTVVVDGEYLVVVNTGIFEIEQTGPMFAESGDDYTLVRYYKGVNGSWEQLTATWAPHYSALAAPAEGDVWVKTTRQEGGLNVTIRKYSDNAGKTSVVKEAVSVYHSQGDNRYFQDGTGDLWGSETSPWDQVEGGVAGDIHIVVDSNDAHLRIKEQQAANQRVDGPWKHIETTNVSETNVPADLVIGDTSIEAGKDYRLTNLILKLPNSFGA